MAAYGQTDSYFLRKTRRWWQMMLAALQRREEQQERMKYQHMLVSAQANVLADAVGQGSDTAKQQWDILWERVYADPAGTTDTTVEDTRLAEQEFTEHSLRAQGVIRAVPRAG